MVSLPLRWFRQGVEQGQPTVSAGTLGDGAGVESQVIDPVAEPDQADSAGTGTPEASAPPTSVDRSVVIGRGVQALAAWSLRLVVIGVTLFLVFWLLGRIWVGVQPILLALVLSSVLYPPVAWLRRHGWPAALAAAIVLVGALLAFGGILTVSAQQIISQSADLANRAADGIQRLRDWVTGAPLNLDSQQLNNLVDVAVDRLRSSATQIASGVFTGVSAVASAVVTGVLVLVLAFLFVKDGPRFLPWLRRQTGQGIGGHLTEVFARSWHTLGSFIRIQALVSLVDAVLIGLGLWALGVPLAPALALLTFVGGFIPIIGAVAAGALAALVALVTNGFTTALLVVALILLVQQIESNVLQPVLQGRSLQLHAAIVILAVTVGGTLFGIIGAFLAVPVAAVGATLLRYLSEQVSLRAGEIVAADVAASTPQGYWAARRGEQAAQPFLRRMLHRRRGEEDDG